VFGWEPGIGDPTIYGWLTVAAYAVGAFCCWQAAQQGPSRERRLWLLLAALMAFLCVNKQLDLQSLFTDIARAEARRQGWYANRREYQVEFIAGLAVGFALITFIAFIRARRASAAARGGIIGMALLLFFVLVRASSFHRMDWLIGLHVGSVRANHVMELSGIAIVSASAWAAARPRPRRR
jgi:hypothetical protein